MPKAALTEAVYYILLSLMEPMHGYGIMQNVEQLSGGRVRLAPGTLYGAINTLLEMLNVPFENSYSFGDSVNDVEMLKVTKQSIVMGNAPEEVKKLATYVTKTAAENGLYEAMEQLNLLQGEINDKK